MNIQKLVKILINSGIEENEASIEVKMLLEGLFGYTEKDRLLGKEPDDSQFNVLEEKIRQRVEEHIPVQYLTGRAWFMGEWFKVTPDVLIPRDETEILVRKSIELINKYNLRKVLDIGTGSGCIACTIAKQTDAVVLGVDISSDALRVALDNVTELNINNKAVFRKSDLFEKIRDDETFDLIVSNPPYIPFGTELQKEVRNEPETALFAEDNGLYYYRRITEAAPKYLNDGGYLIFELGIGESEDVCSMMEKDFHDILILKDLAGIDRVIVGRYIK